MDQLARHRYVTAAAAAHDAYTWLANAQEGHENGPVWQDLTDDQQHACIAGVIALVDEGLTDEQSHDRWAKHLIADGWRRGDKELRDRVHPGLAPLAEIDHQLQARNTVFCATARLVALQYTFSIPVV